VISVVVAQFLLLYQKCPVVSRLPVAANQREIFSGKMVLAPIFFRNSQMVVSTKDNSGSEGFDQ